MNLPRATIALFSSDTALSPEWGLFIATGFCGGLTTFAGAGHLAGSVIITFARIGTIAWIRS